MRLARRAIEPLDHFDFWPMTNEVGLKLKVVEFVCFKSTTIMNEWSRMLGGMSGWEFLLEV